MAQKLSQIDSSICLILNPTQAGAGLCTEYPHRGLICRLFGYSARTNQSGKKELVTCQVIKTEQAEVYNKTVEMISGGADVPVINQFYMQLHAIDSELTKKQSINEAIKWAIEEVLQYYSYRE